MSYAVGSLVRARGREWVVLPSAEDDLLLLRPLGGSDRETTGIYLPLEGSDVSPATFDLPDPALPGDFRSSRLLRDAVRLGFRSSAGPFRSFARLNVEPRPYQLVPLLMALRLDPVRLLIADDVGIGKTIEAGLIARELLDRGEIQRLAVLCPPHLAEQWQAELEAKFHIAAELVLPSTVHRLERDTAANQSLFDLHPFVIVSTDYIKSDRRRDEFVRACPEFVIVDEAHTCAYSAEQRGRHQRHRLLQELASDPDRHLLLVTATPHSGDEGAFRSLLALLRRDFSHLPEDLTGGEHERTRREVARHLVQRRRADIRGYMDEATPFPEREEREVTYQLGEDYRRLFDAVLRYARERVQVTEGGRRLQRVRWWSALALLRSIGSSPAAAAATLRKRSETAEAESEEEADAQGQRYVLDQDDTDDTEPIDPAPGGQDDAQEGDRQRLLRLARQADELHGVAKDRKLAHAADLVAELLRDGFNPILFCRFIPTAEYVAEQLRVLCGKTLPKDVEIAAVTGLLAPAEREERVRALGEHERRVLVATDCLSEGINLQQHFDAVMHYDLSWNPTRHEQREGRVDRYGQPRSLVRTLTLYGRDNQIDGLVLDVLIRKHRTIRTSLGISVPVPGRTQDVIEAIVQGLLLRTRTDSRQLTLGGMEPGALRDLHAAWDNVTEKERRSRTMFAQQAINVSEVAEECRAAREAVGSHVDVERFVLETVRAAGGSAVKQGSSVLVQPPPIEAIRQLLDGQSAQVQFELPVEAGTTYLNRTHPFVEGLAAYVIDSTLDPVLESVGRRCGAMRTRAVTTTTTLLLLRLRYHIITKRRQGENALLAEDCMLVGFQGTPESPQWLAPEAVEALAQAQPDANMAAPQARQFVARVVERFDPLRGPLRAIAAKRGEELLAAHQRVRRATRMTSLQYSVDTHEPDVLGIYVLTPA